MKLGPGEHRLATPEELAAIPVGSRWVRLSGCYRGRVLKVLRVNNYGCVRYEFEDGRRTWADYEPFLAANEIIPAGAATTQPEGGAR